jgi:hypothetical protein
MIATPAVATARSRPVASPVAAAVVSSAVAATTPHRVQVLRHPVDAARSTTSETSVTPAVFAESRTSPSASPASTSTADAASEISAVVPPPPVSFEAP